MLKLFTASHLVIVQCVPHARLSISWSCKVLCKCRTKRSAEEKGNHVVQS